MRDLIIAGIIFGSIPFILRNPFVGLLMWVWVSIMNPHRLTWGFAYDMPFAQVIAIATLIGMLVNVSKLNRAGLDRVAATMGLFSLWLGVSPLFSFHPDYEWDLYIRAIKIQFMVLIGFLLVVERQHLHRLTWVLALSIGFFGIKGGLFTIATAGAYRVWGPSGSFIEDNNTLALAVIMSVPLLRYLQLQAGNAWVSRGCLAVLVLCVIAALGSQSRGALVALLAMGAFLWVKSRQKTAIGMLVLLAVPLVLLLMPDAWFERMATIKSYDQDGSALGRINAWWTAWNVAVDRFPIGAGFAMYEFDVFARYAPDPTDLHAAHSIYFQVLGEHGFVGLALFLLIFLLAWRSGSWVLHQTRDRAGFEWARDLAAMCQVSLIGYAVGGAFLSLTYFDLPYYVVLILSVLRAVVTRELVATPAPAAKPIGTMRA